MKGVENFQLKVWGGGTGLDPLTSPPDVYGLEHQGFGRGRENNRVHDLRYFVERDRAFHGNRTAFVQPNWISRPRTDFCSRMNHLCSAGPRVQREEPWFNLVSSGVGWREELFCREIQDPASAS